MSEEASNEQSGESGEVLVVVSKVKKFIKAQSGMNTSESLVSVLSALVTKACEQAIAHAKDDGRKTVMDRDMQPQLDKLSAPSSSGGM